MNFAVIESPSDFQVIDDRFDSAIILPTFRWDEKCKAIVGSTLGIENEKIAVLIADNSENEEKWNYLKNLSKLNPNIYIAAHQKNIGALGNFNYLYQWCRRLDYVATMADDDWFSPCYHTEAINHLRSKLDATCIEAGTTFINLGDGIMHNASQPSMTGETALERIAKWQCNSARATMYNASPRRSLDNAIEYINLSPMPGMTLAEDLWELSRLAQGNFLKLAGDGVFVHTPTHGSIYPGAEMRFYNLLCKDQGYKPFALYFMSLSTAIQCAIFLIGSLSPLNDQAEKFQCSQMVFSHIYKTAFLPKVQGHQALLAAKIIFADYPSVLNDFIKYTTSPYADNPSFDLGVLNWFFALFYSLESQDIPGKSTTLDFFQFLEKIKFIDLSKRFGY
jgi:glycosyltransferase involved in cell wall biosynthesis